MALIIIIQCANPAFCAKPSKAEWVKSIATGLFSAPTALALITLPTPNCHWCATNNFDENISRALVWKNYSSLYSVSDAFAFGLAPVMAFGSVALGSSEISVFVRDALIVFDSVAFTALVTEISKLSARRARPEAVFGYRQDEQSNRSFWSGHTSLTFAMLSSASTLALKNGYVWAPYFVASSALVAGFVSYSRIAAAKHWMSDVLLGMVVGTTIGISMPFFVLDAKDVGVTFSKNGVGVSIAW